jgi:tetratricopeptide (TPR) repeat protein
MIIGTCGMITMGEEKRKEDPVKLHKDSNTLYELGKFVEAEKGFLIAAELYKKKNNFFDSAFMLFKAGECAYNLKNYEEAAKYFSNSIDLSLDKGFDRFGVSGLEYLRDCYKALKKEEEVEETTKKIIEIKEKLELF